MKKVRFIAIILCLLLLVGCNKKEEKNIVNVLNWSSYIPDSVIKDFQEETNIKVNYGTYSSNEELLAKVSSSKKGTYDVIFPSDYMIELMKERNLIEKIDKYKFTNYKNLNPEFLNKPYDYNNEYSLPFLTTIVVIAINRDNIKDNISSYKDLLNEKYKNNIVLLDDQRIMIGAALLGTGFDMNTVNPRELSAAKDYMLKLKPNIKAYDSDSPKTFLITKEADIGIMWHAEAEIAESENPNIEIIYPNEGHAISTDNYAIVKGAKNVENAYKFIDFLMRNDIAKKITIEYPYISSNNIIQESKVPIDYVFNKGYYVKNIGDKIKEYDKLWADIK